MTRRPSLPARLTAWGYPAEEREYDAQDAAACAWLRTKTAWGLW